MFAILFAAFSVLGTEAQPGSTTTLYYDDKGADFAPWIRPMLAEVQRTLLASEPKATSTYSGQTAVGCTFDREGNIITSTVIVESGVPTFDDAAVRAARAVHPRALPTEYPDDHFDIVIVFWLNREPYDIFEGNAENVWAPVQPTTKPEASKVPTSEDGAETSETVRGARVLWAQQNTYIYKEPSAASARLKSLAAGEAVRVTSKTNQNYWEVHDEGVHGFVNELVLVSEEPKPSRRDEAADFAPGAYRMGGGITPPRLKRQATPSYTQNALTKRVEGAVLLEVVILSDGKVGPVRVVEGLPEGLNDEAIKCVRLWEFVPARLAGQPVDLVVEIEVTFSIYSTPK